MVDYTSTKSNLLCSVTLLLLMSVFILPNHAHSQPKKLVNYKVIDGNTLYNGKREVLLYGVDAPELGQTCLRDQEIWQCGREAKQKLRQIIQFQPVECKLEKVDKLNRLLSTCYVRGEDFNKRMVREGWAMAYQRHTKRYVEDERKAKDEHIGIWQSLFDDFRSFRQLNPRQNQ